MFAARRTDGGAHIGPAPGHLMGALAVAVILASVVTGVYAATGMRALGGAGWFYLIMIALLTVILWLGYRVRFSDEAILIRRLWVPRRIHWATVKHCEAYTFSRTGDAGQAGWLGVRLDTGKRVALLPVTGGSFAAARARTPIGRRTERLRATTLAQLHAHHVMMGFDFTDERVELAKIPEVTSLWARYGIHPAADDVTSGYEHMDGRSVAARAWLDTVEPRDATLPVVSMDDVVAPLMTLGIADLQALRFEGGLGANPDGGFGQRVLLARPAIGLSRGLLTVLIAPGDTHRAVLWSPDARDTARLWVDSREVALPVGERGATLVAHYLGDWCDEHLFAQPIVAAHHPGQDWLTSKGMGNVFGLLLYDARTGHQQLELPRDNETWTEPVADRRDGSVLIYSDPDARTARTPARVISLSR